MRTLEDKIRAFCVASLDMVADSDRFDFVEDLGAELPMRTIGMLLGIPDADQPSVREHARATLQNDTGGPMQIRKDHYFDGDMFSDYVEWRKQNPSDDLITELLSVDFEDQSGTVRRLTTPSCSSFWPSSRVQAWRQREGYSVGWARSWPTIPTNARNSLRTGH